MSRTDDNSTDDTTLSPAWTFPGSFGLPATPLVVAGDRLLGISSSAVFAVDIHTGGPAATTTPDRDWLQPIESFFGPTPKVAAADGIVYMSDGDDLKAIGLGDGDPLPGWTMPRVPGVAALTVHEGTLIAVHLNASGATVVSGFAAATGKPSFPPRTISPESPGSIDYGNGAVFFVAEGALHAVNVDYGDPRWRFLPASDPLTASVAPLVADRTVLVSGRALYAVDIEKGQKRFEITSTAGRDATWSTPAADIPAAPVAASRAANFQLAHGLQDARNGTPLTGHALAAAVLGRTYGGRAVATSSAGDIVCFALSDGAILWRTTTTTVPGAPVIIDDKVYITTHGQKRLARFNLNTGQEFSGYLLPDLADSQAPAIANGSLFLTSDAGDIVARPFATQSAAFFDGVSSMIAVKPEGTQFDFGTDDFTIEAWFRSSSGGEILSSYPTSNDPNTHGIRINLTPAGQIRVAVTNASQSSYAVRRTRRAGAADGEWHHLAVVRRSGAFMVAVDGRSHDVLAPEGAKDEALAIGGKSALTIGAYVASATARPSDYFRGLIREVRIWDRALDLSTIANNKNSQLIGAEPRLKGLWRLAEAQTPESPIEPINEVRKHRVRATFVNPGSRPTDLMMDGSAFPYLLHESKQQWPYAGTWAARGATSLRGSAAVSANGIAAYGTISAIYAVDAHEGKRAWGMDVVLASDPVADGGDFLVLTKAESLVRLDARRGGKMQISAFPTYSSTARPIAPACNATYIAAAMGGNAVSIWDRSAPKARTVAVDGTPERLAFGPAGLVVVTRAASALKLVLINPKTATVRGTISVSGDAFCMAGDSLFAVVDGTVARFDGASLGAGPKVKSARLGEGITGLLALGDDATIVATTVDGVVYGLTLGGLSRWTTPLPVGRAGGKNSINPPALDSNTRVVCTTSSGTVAILDGRTGAIGGLYSTMHAAIGTPAIAAGTVFTGCADVRSAANDDLAEVDGALHSIVFGETTALRLNLDAAGTPVSNGRQHATITVAGDAAALRLLNAHESCVEAWVNLPRASKGGGIVGIAPTTVSRFDVNLWIEPDGTLHYTSHALDGTAWSGVHVTAATTIIDGKWHHVAASRSLATSQPASNAAPDRVIIYVDGVAMTTHTVAPPAAPTKLATGLRACVGATLDAALAASRPFCGLIADARVWDTYLVASEISSRMSVKLRGDEPGLIAYWNFDLGRVADASRDGHDGELAVTPTQPAWWLTDLTFSQPSYPFITSTAAIASQKAGEPTMYALTVKVCSADGKGMAGQDVHAWYVKRAADDAASIFVNGVELQAVSSDDEPHPKVLRLQKAFSGKTLSDGTLRLRVSSTLPGHGPALDLWTTFMPMNERFHVDVLIDNQSLAKPTPPALTAQAKLIQDYHYTTGNKVDETRDRSTWRIVMRAADPGDVPRPDEPVTLWASESATIEVLGQKHVVNADNAVTVMTEQTGELTVVMAAAGLTAPTLYARAGFMHRNDRVVIDPHQDTHAQLNRLDSAEMTKPRMTNWKRGAKEDEGPTLLRDEHKTHAPDIAKAIRDVTTIAKPADPHAPPRAGRLLRAARAPRLAMRQPVVDHLDDGVVLRRTLAGVARPAPVDADAFRDAMGGALGFMIETGPKGFVYTPITSHVQLAMIRAADPPLLTRPDHLLGAFWDVIVDFAKDVYDRVERIVVTVADAVQIAITTMIDETRRIVNIVVDSIDKALDAVAGFFKALAVELEKVIEFLRVIFNWQAIINTQKILTDVFKASANMAIASTKDMGDFTKSIAALAKLPTTGIPADAPSVNSESASQGSHNDPVVASSRSVEGKSMMQKTTTSPVNATSAASPAPTLPSSNPLDVILREIPALASSVLDLSPGDLVAELQRILAKAADATLVTAGQAIAGIVKGFAEPVKWVIDLLNARINIPFITDLYEWITGSTLTLANVVCLVLAIPVNIAYAAITLIKDGRARKFADDAKGLPAEMTRPRLEGAAESNVVPATPVAAEVVFVVFRAITCIADSSLDAAALSKARAKGGAGFLGDKAIGVFKIMSGVAGMITLTVQNVLSNKAFERRVRAVADKPDDKQADQFLPPWEWLTWTIYGVLMALRLKNIVVGGMAVRATGPASSDPTLVTIESVATKAASFISLPLLIIQIVQLEKLRPIIKGFGNDNVAEQYRLFAIRDIMGTVGLMFELFFSTTDLADHAAIAPPPGWDFHGFAVNVRAATGATATVLHAVAVFGYGD